MCIYIYIALIPPTEGTFLTPEQHPLLFLYYVSYYKLHILTLASEVLW